MTSIKRLITIIGISGALTGFPLTLEAITSNEYAPSKTMAASSTWDVRQAADALFQDIQSDAQQARNHAATLQSFQYSPDITWKLHGSQLNQLKTEVNDMVEKVCRLEKIRPVLAPWQQETTDRIASKLPLMAVDVTDAIYYVNTHQHELMNLTYWRYADNLCSEAADVTQSAGNAVKYANVLGEYDKLRAVLGVATKAS